MLGRYYGLLKNLFINRLSQNRAADLMLVAMNKGDLNQIQNLLEAGFDINYQDSQKNTVLHLFLLSSTPRFFPQAKLWSYLITETKININLQNLDGNTILHLLCMHANAFSPMDFSQILQLVINKNADTMLTNQQNLIPLYTYFFNRFGNMKTSTDIDLHVLDFLLKNTKNINFPSTDGKTLVHYIRSLFSNEVNNFGLKIWKTILEYAPDLNSVDNDGMHILDDLAEGGELYNLLIKYSAQPVTIPVVEKLIQASDKIQATATRIYARLKSESSLQPDADMQHLVDKIKCSNAYRGLEKTLDEQLSLTSLVKECVVTSLDELEALQKEYFDSCYIFINRQELLSHKKASVYVCKKAEKSIFDKLVFPELSRRRLGWELLSRQLNAELSDIAQIKVNIQSVDLDCYDATQSDIPMLVHATNAMPEVLEKSLHTKGDFFNDMLYISCSLVDKNSIGFTLIPHKDSPLRVHLILDVDPKAICAYSPGNLSSPYARGCNTFKNMFEYFKSTIKKIALENFVFQQLYAENVVTYLKNTPSIHTVTGLQQIRSQTGYGLHNEILVLGGQISNDLGAKPTRIIGVAIDKSDLMNVQSDSNLKRSMQIIQKSGLPILLVDFNKKSLKTNPRYPLCERLKASLELCEEAKKKYIQSCYRTKRLGTQENLQVSQQFFQNKNQALEQYANLYTLTEEYTGEKLKLCG